MISDIISFESSMTMEMTRRTELKNRKQVLKFHTEIAQPTKNRLLHHLYHCHNEIIMSG